MGCWETVGKLLGNCWETVLACWETVGKLLGNCWETIFGGWETLGTPCWRVGNWCEAAGQLVKLDARTWEPIQPLTTYVFPFVRRRTANEPIQNRWPRTAVREWIVLHILAS